VFKTSTSLACIVYYDAYKVLKSYTVTVNGSATTTMTNQTVSTYTFNNRFFTENCGILADAISPLSTASP